jgi:hypothetical protein
MDMRHAWVFGLLFAGCSVDQESFPKQSADALCPLYKKCQYGYFDSNFEDMAACKTYMEEYSENWVYIMENALACNYDSKEAGSCIGDLSTMSCAELYEISGLEDACADVFTGCIEE